MDVVRSASFIDENQLDELCQKAQEVIRELNLEDKKKTIHDIIDRVVIHDEGKLEVMGHVPAFTPNMAYEPKHRDSEDTTRYKIPFEFIVRLPEPRKARTITNRDKLGRIVWTKAK